MKIKLTLITFLAFSFLITPCFAEKPCIDSDGDGWGWDGKKSCKMQGFTSKKAASTQNKENTGENCQDWAEVSYKNYKLQNNTWGSKFVKSNRWFQCIKLEKKNDKFVPSWSWDFLDRNPASEINVKSYPQVYYGRKAGRHISAPKGQIPLPEILSKAPRFKVHYKYTDTGDSEKNVALETFFHTTCEAEQKNKAFEMMVWLKKPSIRTPGKPKGEAKIDGTEWKVYNNPPLPFPYIAFVRKEDSNEGVLDWNKFIDWTIENGEKLGIGKLSKDFCMATIEMGTEIFWGKGSFRLEKFDVEVVK